MADKDLLRDIHRLFDMAEKNPDMAKRYIRLAKKMAMRNTIKIPGELKRKFCPKCFSLFSSKNSETRIKKGFRVIKCLECGNYKRVKIF